MDMDPSKLLETIVIPWGIKIALALVIFYVGRIVVETEHVP